MNTDELAEMHSIYQEFISPAWPVVPVFVLDFFGAWLHIPSLGV